ncbi:unnamed protein product [Aphis gossypii]|uniref:Uncharacterized protein n=1 Tax=Aphis gossypii TaxID=80765 RepID=A0A9P0J1C7_APHGO|nr:unnamed protein product [Aphis gossypii]
MRSAAVAGLCRVSTNRVVLFVLCPYKVMPRDGRKAAVHRASPPRGGAASGAGNHGRRALCAPRPRPIGARRHRPRRFDGDGFARQDAHRPRTVRPLYENFRNRSVTDTRIRFQQLRQPKRSSVSHSTF